MRFLGLVFSFFISFCCFADSAPVPVRPGVENLTQAYAEFRKSQVQSVAYNLSFSLTSDAKTYGGRASLLVRLARTDLPLSVDFLGSKIDSISVNGASVKDYVARPGSFDIPVKYLRPENTIVVTYTNEFNQTPTGFYRYEDPVDHRIYLYSDFEPYQAHRLFPCFDQPDLKATFDVHVLAPPKWKVISNGIAKVTGQVGNQAKTEFHFTHPLSTYLFFLGAGDYKEWREARGKLPLLIYTRQSMAKYVDAKAMFTVVRKGLDYYSKYFGYEYPFPQYGQVFIPDFEWGGMENPGAITMNEGMIFRGRPTSTQLRGRTDTILHEMAHMWFGDLVTMKWWNDTWLNESFATYMATLAQAEAVKDTSTWDDFYSQKTWGYWQDSLVTTHPIEAPIPDTVNAKGNFDGITYSKGAAALQQLRYFVGPQAFQKGVQNYFQKFGKSNATRADFVSEIALAAHQDLVEWTHAWLQTPGPNRVAADWQCASGKIKEFKLTQKKNVGGVYSPHKTKIGLYQKDQSGHLKKIWTESFAYSGANNNVAAMIGKVCPDFVYPNEDDEDYALFSLDPASLKVAVSDVSSLESPLLRLMTWGTLNEMVWDGQLRPMDYMLSAIRALPKETDEDLLSVLLNKYSEIKPIYFEYLTPAQRQSIAGEFENTIWNSVAKAEHGSNLQLIYFDFALAVSRTEASQSKIADLLDGKSSIVGLKPDQDRRWAALKVLSASGNPTAVSRIESETKKDPSDRGRISAFAAKNAFPGAALRQSLWPELLKPGALDESKFQTTITWFQNPNHPDLEKPYIDPFFKAMKGLDWNNPVHRDRVQTYFSGLFPRLCTSDILSQSERELKSADHLNDDAVRAWREENDLLSRCIRARNL